MEHEDKDLDASNEEADLFELKFHRTVGSRQANVGMVFVLVGVFFAISMFTSGRIELSSIVLILLPCAVATRFLDKAHQHRSQAAVLEERVRKYGADPGKAKTRLWGVAIVILFALIGSAPLVAMLASFRLPRDPWEYQSHEHGFSLRLPSSRWKQATKPIHLVDFQFRTLAEMVAGVVSVEQQSANEFAAGIHPFKMMIIEQAGDSKSPMDAQTRRGAVPTFQDGETDAGNRYVFGSYKDRGDPRASFTYTASCLVSLRDKTVRVLVEGHGRMASDFLQSVEAEEFETAAKSICLSVR